VFPVILLAAMAGMNLIGGIMQSQQMRAAGAAAKAGGKYQQQLAESRARGLEIQSGQELAASQRAMMAERQQGALVSGRARALAAASGASMASPSIVQGLTDIAGSEENRVGLAKYQGETEAANLRYGAALTRSGGEMARQAGSFENRLANARANAALLQTLTSSAATAAGAFGGGGSAAATPAVATSGGATMGGYQMGWAPSSGLMQMGSPMFQRYGQGGP